MTRCLLFGLLLISFVGWSQKKQKSNVLSYYAVTNSIDGQPLINERNLLRYYPVFALRDSIEAVKVTLYYGNEVFIEEAIKFHGGLYWEVKLPEFELGDAIQRYEVEARLKYFIDFDRELRDYRKQLFAKTIELVSSLEDYKIQSDTISKILEDASNQLSGAKIKSEQTIEKLTKLNENIQSIQFENFRKTFNDLYDSLKSVKNEAELLDVQKSIETLRNAGASISSSVTASQNKYDTLLDSLFTNYKNPGTLLVTKVLPFIDKNFKPIKESYKEQKDVDAFIISRQFLLDSLKGSLLRKLTDKNYTGSGVQASDIVFEKGYRKARILYRNYRMENRTLVALDPAERLSVFRLRYIPFPVIGKQRVGPSITGIPVVFEAAITFGNQVITSNEFTMPELSIRRLGVGVAFTPELFKEDARILALLLSYDFNAYASIGVGANFGKFSENGPDPYFSFGINQRAFQMLVAGIGNIFKK